MPICTKGNTCNFSSVAMASTQQYSVTIPYSNCIIPQCPSQFIAIRTKGKGPSTHITMLIYHIKFNALHAPQSKLSMCPNRDHLPIIIKRYTINTSLKTTIYFF